MKFFVANLMNGKQVIFGKKCNSIDYNTFPNTYMFKQIKDDGTFDCLGIIPLEHIYSIISFEE